MKKLSVAWQLDVMYCVHVHEYDGRVDKSPHSIGLLCLISYDYIFFYSFLAMFCHCQKDRNTRKTKQICANKHAHKQNVLRALFRRLFCDITTPFLSVQLFFFVCFIFVSFFFVQSIRKTTRDIKMVVKSTQRQIPTINTTQKSF